MGEPSVRSPSHLDAWRARVEAALTAHGFDGAPPRLVEAMQHLLLAPSKRLRPLIALAAGAACRPALSEGALFDAVTPAALALELIHTYSLVHDDLPALDDDAVRRGRPTVHVAFDEATAILVGDALLTDAFALLAAAPTAAAAQVRELAVCAGSAGMVGGQHDDLFEESKDLDALASIHVRKTARLFRAAAALGALAVGSADSADDARRYGEHLGLAFQIQDDVLDVIGDASGGKAAGRDVRNEKVTYVTLLGVEGARRRARHEAERAVEAAQAFAAPDVLTAIARYAADRDR
jgi:geranylgeranyl pyrophosphate synthase